MSSPDETFRDELRSWLTEHPPPAVEVAATSDEAETLREWQRTLHAGPGSASTGRSSTADAARR